MIQRAARGYPFCRPRLTTAGRATAPLRHLTLWRDCQRCGEHAPSARTPLILIVRSASTMLSCRRDASGFSRRRLAVGPSPSFLRQQLQGKVTRERVRRQMRTCHANCAFCGRIGWVGENADLKTVGQPLAAAVPLLHKTLWILILPSLAANRLAVSDLTSRATSCAARSGMRNFRGLQAGVIGELLAGRSALAVLPTGGGKSLCYQIPSLLRPGLGLVVSPLIALMADQVAALQQLGVAAERLDSSTSLASRDDIWRRIKRRHSGLTVCLARRPDAAHDAATPHRPAARSGGDRRSPLRQPVGPRLSPRIPHARPPCRHLSACAAARRHRHRGCPHARRYPRRATPCRRP